MDNSSSLEKAAALIKAGQKKRAQRILTALLRRDIENETGWVLLAQAVSEPAKQRECLGYALAINPQNAAARDMLAELDRNTAPVPSSGGRKPRSPARGVLAESVVAGLVPASPDTAEQAHAPDTAEQAIERLRGAVARLELGKQKQRRVLWESLAAAITLVGVALLLSWFRLYALLPLVGLGFGSMLVILVIILVRQREFDAEIAVRRQELAQREKAFRRRR
jgi:hypothetical protein